MCRSSFVSFARAKKTQLLAMGLKASLSAFALTVLAFGLREGRLVGGPELMHIGAYMVVATIAGVVATFGTTLVPSAKPPPKN